MRKLEFNHTQPTWLANKCHQPLSNIYCQRFYLLDEHTGDSTQLFQTIMDNKSASVTKQTKQYQLGHQYQQNNITLLNH